MGWILPFAMSKKYTDEQIARIGNVGSIPGPKGDPGEPGTNGKTWYMGTIAPMNTTGAIGDFYLNIETWDIYEKTTATTWTLSGNIKGEPGTPGANGKTWHMGTTTPGNTLGAIGDFYLNTATWDIYSKTAITTWDLLGNIKGAPGGSSGGTTGTNGNTWYTGTTAPGNTTGVTGDLYLNTATWDIYEKTASTTWTLKGNIKGGTGATGPQGPPGSDVNIEAHEVSAAPHQYGGKFEWRYNPVSQSLDLVVLE